MEPIRLGRFVLPGAASVALHGAGVVVAMLLGRALPPTEPLAPIAVELAFAAAAGTPEAASPAEPPAALPVQAEASPVEPPAPPPVVAAPPPRQPPPRRPPARAAARPSVTAPVLIAPVGTAMTVAAPAPVPGPPAINPSSAWIGALDAWIDAHLDYPEDSRRRGEQGAVLVRLTVAHDGRLLDFAVLHGSGYDELDDATKAMFRHARLPAAPLDSDPAQTTLSKPVRYVLR